MLNTKFIIGIIFAIISALIFIIGKSNSTIPPAIIFLVLGIIFIATSKKQ
ncbi:hypothetical protein [Clostridium ganghwense]|uniref:Exosortase n=1 Tax=Clostridium ganghwense TaxID=312089 RepID=A0ABT4CVY3_9CLOT|nr:hypothetical protein [Clostridium ganghwense]MCY6372598.1 hypothetical protein [Clostridium ganghwense]